MKIAISIQIVLIVPLWNWNSVRSIVLRISVRFNRTFMELKYDDEKEICTAIEF